MIDTALVDRDFVPWSFLDAGSISGWSGLVIAGVQEPAQNAGVAVAGAELVAGWQELFRMAA